MKVIVKVDFKQSVLCNYRNIKDEIKNAGYNQLDGRIEEFNTSKDFPNCYSVYHPGPRDILFKKFGT